MSDSSVLSSRSSVSRDSDSDTRSDVDRSNTDTAEQSRNEQSLTDTGGQSYTSPSAPDTGERSRNPSYADTATRSSEQDQVVRLAQKVLQSEKAKRAAEEAHLMGQHEYVSALRSADRLSGRVAELEQRMRYDALNQSSSVERSRELLAHVSECQKPSLSVAEVLAVVEGCAPSAMCRQLEEAGRTAQKAAQLQHDVDRLRKDNAVLKAENDMLKRDQQRLEDELRTTRSAHVEESVKSHQILRIEQAKASSKQSLIHTLNAELLKCSHHMRRLQKLLDNFEERSDPRVQKEEFSAQWVQQAGAENRERLRSCEALQRSVVRSEEDEAMDAEKQLAAERSAETQASAIGARAHDRVSSSPSSQRQAERISLSKSRSESRGSAHNGHDVRRVHLGRSNESDVYQARASKGGSPHEASKRQSSASPVKPGGITDAGRHKHHSGHHHSHERRAHHSSTSVHVKSSLKDASRVQSSPSRAKATFDEAVGISLIKYLPQESSSVRSRISFNMTSPIMSPSA